MKRYFQECSDMIENTGPPHEDDWVRWSDHEKAMAAVSRGVDKLRRALREIAGVFDRMEKEDENRTD